MNRSRSIVLSIVLLTITAAATAQTVPTTPTTPTPSTTEPWHWGFKAGTNIYKFSGQSFQGGLRFGYNGGIYAEKQLVGRLGIQPELLVSEITGETSDQFNNIFHGASFQQVMLTYVSLPILLTYKINDAFTFLIGPQYGYMVNQTQNLIVTSTNPPKSVNVFEKNDLELLFGGQLNLGRMRLGARYAINFVQLNKVYPGAYNLDSWKDQGFQIYLTYRMK